MNQRLFKTLTGGLLGLIAVGGALLLSDVASSAGKANAIINFTCCDYAPKVITVTTGDSVTWNGDFGFHPLQQAESATSDANVPGGFVAGGGSTFTHVFSQTGTFYYLCAIHGTGGGQMRGEVRVLAPGQIVTPTAPACYTFDVTFGPETGEITTTATGRGFFLLNTEFNTLSYMITYTGLTSAETNAHFHAFTPPATSGPPIVSQPLSAGSSPKIGVWNYANEDIEKQILDGHVYVNVHSANHTGGEIKANLLNPVKCKQLFLPVTQR